MTIFLSSLDFSLPLTNPVIIFSIVLFIILFAPLLLNKIKVPHIIGLIIAGVLVGPYGFNLLARDSSIILFGTVGLLYIMFLAGLELDLGEFKKNAKKILVFGFTSFVLPFILGGLAGYYILGYPWVSSILLASLLSTHTLVSYPIASKYGIAQNKSVLLSVGGTIVTDIFALAVLVAVTETTKENVNSMVWLQLGISMLIFIAIVFFVFPLIIRWFFKNFEDSVSQYIFVLAMVFLASFLAQAAGTEAIVGALFSGLVLNKFIPARSALMNRIDFVGNALFIPFFLISVGMLVDMSVLVKGWRAIEVAAVIIVAAIVGKWLAAVFTQKVFKLSRAEGSMIFGLSTSRAAATLAIVLIGYNIILGETESGQPIRLLDEDILNGTILLILVSCAISSFVVEKASIKLAKENDEDEAATDSDMETDKILVSLNHDDLTQHLMDFAMMLKPKNSAEPVYALQITEDEDITNNSEKKLLDKAVKHGSATENMVIPLTRHDSSMSNGIVYTIKEYGITDVVIGIHESSNQNKLLGPTVEHILKRAWETIYIYKPKQPLNTFNRILVLVPHHAETEPGFTHWYEKMMVLTKESGKALHIFASAPTITEIKRLNEEKSSKQQIELHQFYNWDDFLIFSRELKQNDLFIIISSRKGGNSYMEQMDKLSYYLTNYFSEHSFILLYPSQVETGINMVNIEQTDASLLESLSERISHISHAGKIFKNIFKDKEKN